VLPSDEVFNEKVRQAMEKALGLDRPVLVQYLD
jgi:hypothetical protein